MGERERERERCVEDGVLGWSNHPWVPGVTWWTSNEPATQVTPQYNLVL